MVAGLRNQSIGIRPGRACLGRTTLDSNNSIHHFLLLTFPPNRGICFSLKDNSNGLKTWDSCTVRYSVDALLREHVAKASRTITSNFPVLASCADSIGRLPPIRS